MIRFDQKLPLKILWVFFVLTVWQSISLLVWYWPDGLPDGNIGGIWTSLAYDFAQGVFYRPLFSEDSYGGTRYLPFFFVFHGLLIKVFGHPLTTGVFLTLTSAFALAAAIYFILRELGLSWRLALPFAVVMNCALSYQMTTLTVRGDFMAAAFNWWAVWLALKYNSSGSRPFLFTAGLLFLCAFLTKATSVFGLAAVSFFFFVTDRKSTGIKLALFTATSMTAALAAINFLSDGRALKSFMACATGGGPGLSFNFIVRFVEIAAHDPFFLALFGVSLYVFVRHVREAWREPPFILFGAALTVTLIIFSSPGTAKNHLIDLMAAMSILLAVRFSKDMKETAGMSVLFSLISIYIVLSWFPFTPSIKKSYLERGKPRRENVTHLYRQYGPTAAPVLSQHPLFSILNGKRPLIGDHFNLTVLRKKFPEIREDYTNKIKSQYFGSIVLQNWPPIFEKDIESVDDPHFKEKAEAFHESQRVDDFYDLFLEYYEIASVQRPFVYYLPKDLSQPTH